MYLSIIWCLSKFRFINMDDQRLRLYLLSFRIIRGGKSGCFEWIFNIGNWLREHRSTLGDLKTQWWQESHSQWPHLLSRNPRTEGSRQWWSHLHLGLSQKKNTFSTPIFISHLSSFHWQISPRILLGRDSGKCQSGSLSCDAEENTESDKHGAS